ncbi:phosphoenolpyruvate--protein phosphotransferase [Paludisphaera rhizosphaerae]|uniref:phosphoenolpyruvate--protein phosphotransferase n=1 Tax=Paludisphaera rhizosphaerae TaxID=2711216 RepID=UPI0013EC136A|nr:phosphoenolpyruvate--protein phosphotransferase [Paludisphaera rhizosphaerae]
MTLGVEGSSLNRGVRPHESPTPGDSAASEPAEQVLRGIGVSPGIAIGPVMVLDRRGLRLPPRRVAPEAVPGEIARLEAALAAAAAEGAEAEAEARSRLGRQYADILAAHAAMIQDPQLKADAHARIERLQISAEHAVIEVLEAHASRLENLSDSHLAARAADVRDIEARIVAQLAGGRPASFQDELETPSLVLTHDLTPSDAAQLDPTRVLGFATEAGGRASHTAIVAAALEIPAVVGLGPALDHARSTRLAIVDGEQGVVILDPSPETLARHRAAAEERTARYRTLSAETGLPATTVDDVEIGLYANIEFIDEAAASRKWGAAGVGLFRTEFLYLRSPAPPSEDEQFAAYAEAVQTQEGRPVVIRTLDLGADKLAPHLGVDAGVEANPALGLRSLRFSLRRPELFRTQLRAILRASALGDVRVLLPLVTTLNELRQARAILDEVAAELRAEGRPLREALPLGLMVEVPAAAIMADRFAKEVDFFSIGTNDLIQYALAVDRTNETVADLYSAADPAVLRLIAGVVEAASAQGIPCGVCGSMGGELLFTILLLGLGVRELSMPPHQLPEVRRLIRGVRLEQARAVAAEALRLDTAAEVVALLESALRPAETAAAAPAG